MSDTTKSIGFAALQLIPTIVGVTDAVNASLGGLTTAGKTMGKTLGDGITSGVEGAKAKVEQAADKVSAALKKVEDQTGKVKVAQAQYQALQDKGITDAGRLAAAQEKVEAAQRNLTVATDAHTKATDAHKRSQDNLAKAEKDAGDAAQKSAEKQSVLKGFTEQSGKAIDGLSEKMKSFAKTAAAGLGFGAGLGIVGITKSLLDMGETFENVNKTIVNATGASGEKLESLNKSVENIAVTSPKAMGDIATAIGEVAKTTQLTGAPLETLTKQMMKLGAMGQAVDIGSVTQSMRAFGVPADQMSAQLDEIFKVARGTGVPLQELVGTLQSGAPQLQQFGLNASQSASLLGGLKLTGLDSEKAMGALSKALNALSKDGGDLKTNFTKATAEIKQLADSGQQAEAITKASKLFGAKADLPMIKAIQEGKLSLDAMNDSLTANQKGILDSAAAPATLSGAWQNMKNVLAVELKPAAEKVAAVMQDAIKWFKSTGVPLIKEFGAEIKKIWNSGPAQSFLAVIKDIGKFVLDHKEAMGYFAGTILAVVAAVKAWEIAQAALNVVMNLNPIGIVVTAIAALAAGIIYVYNHSETFRKIVQAAWSGIKLAVEVVVHWFTDVVWPTLKKVWEAIGDGWHWLVTKAEEVWTGVKEKFTAMVDFVTSLPDKIANVGKNLWEGLKGGLVGVLNWIGDKWNSFADGLSVHIPGTDIDVKVPHMPKFDGGGYTGDLPTKAIAGVVHGGEQVIKAESTRKINNALPGLLDYLNDNGKLPGFEAGGLVPSDKLVSFAKGVEGKPYVWGGVNWGDCSGAISALANFATGRDPFGSRFATATEGAELAARGFKTGVGPAGSLNVGWFNGGPYGGHTAATLPNGTHFEMGGNRGNGQFGGAAAGADDRQFTDHAFLPMAATQLDKGAPTTGAGSASGKSAGEAPTSSSSGGSAAKVPTSISGLAGLFGEGWGDKLIPNAVTRSDKTNQKGLNNFGNAATAAVGGQVSSLLGVFGVPDSPGWLNGLSQAVGQISIKPKAEPGPDDPSHTYDSGGWLPEGTSLVHNKTGGPEPVLTNSMWNVAQDGVKVAMAVAKGITGGSGSASAKAAPQVNYTINARDTEDAFVRARQRERERAAAKLDRF